MVIRIELYNAFTLNLLHEHKKYNWHEQSLGPDASIVRACSSSPEAVISAVGLNLQRTEIHGIVFDMDGTLIEPSIDFADMRRRIHEIADLDPLLKDSPENVRRDDVLKISTLLSSDGKEKAQTVFKDIETKAIRDMKLMDGLGELCEYLDSQGIQRAVLTRNVCKSVDVMEKKLQDEHSIKGFFPTVSRETRDVNGKLLPSKPSPEPIHHICEIWQCSAKHVIMVGDSEADDIVAASRAGCGAKILLKFNGQSLDNDSGGKDILSNNEKTPSLTITSLKELRNILLNSN